LPFTHRPRRGRPKQRRTTAPPRRGGCLCLQRIQNPYSTFAGGRTCLCCLSSHLPGTPLSFRPSRSCRPHATPPGPRHSPLARSMRQPMSRLPGGGVTGRHSLPLSVDSTVRTCAPGNASRTRTRTHTRAHTRMQTHTHTHTNTRMHMHTHARTYTHTTIHTHAHMHTHMHAGTSSGMAPDRRGP
jgi:hypothetical protein